jgi:hypothetical protein
MKTTEADMINAVSSTAHTLTPAAALQTTAAPKAASNPEPAAPSDTVQISAAAQALKEVIENPAQTAHEAANGDQVAKRLLAREATDKLV